MILIETNPGRWVVRDTPHAPAWAIITERASDAGSVFHANEWHVLPSDRDSIGDYGSLQEAFSAVAAFVVRSRRARTTA